MISRSFLCLLIACAPTAFSATLDRHLIDFLTSDVFRSHIEPEYADVDRFLGTQLDWPESSPVPNIPDHLARIKSLLDHVLDDGENMSVSRWTETNKPVLSRALHGFHTDAVSRAVAEDSQEARFLKNLFYFVALFNGQPVEAINPVMEKIARDMELIRSPQPSNTQGGRLDQKAFFVSFANQKLEKLIALCHLAKTSVEGTQEYKFEAIRSLLEIARGLHALAPECDLETFREMIESVSVLDFGHIKVIAPHFVQQTRRKIYDLETLVTECISRL